MEVVEDAPPMVEPAAAAPSSEDPAAPAPAKRRRGPYGTRLQREILREQAERDASDFQSMSKAEKCRAKALEQHAKKRQQRADEDEQPSASGHADVQQIVVAAPPDLSIQPVLPPDDAQMILAPFLKPLPEKKKIKSEVEEAVLKAFSHSASKSSVASTVQKHADTVTRKTRLLGLAAGVYKRQKALESLQILHKHLQNAESLGRATDFWQKYKYDEMSLKLNVRDPNGQSETVVAKLLQVVITWLAQWRLRDGGLVRAVLNIPVHLQSVEKNNACCLMHAMRPLLELPEFVKDTLQLRDRAAMRTCRNPPMRSECSGRQKSGGRKEGGGSRSCSWLSRSR